MTMVTQPWCPGRPAVKLVDALAAALKAYDTGDIAEEALGVARQNSDAISGLIAVLVKQGMLSPGMALQICGANHRYEVVDAPADGT